MSFKWKKLRKPILRLGKLDFGVKTRINRLSNHELLRLISLTTVFSVLKKFREQSLELAKKRGLIK